MGDIDEATMRAIREAQGGSGRRRAAVNYAQEKVIDAAPEAPRRRRLTKGADKKKPKKAARRVDSDDFLDDESEDDDDSDGGYGGPRKRRAAPPKRRAAKPKRRRRGSDSDESDDDDDDDDDDESDDGWSDDSGRGAKGRQSKKVVRRPGRSGAVGKYTEPGSGDEDWSSGSDGGGGAVAAPAPEKVQSRIEKLLAQREVGGGGADGDGDGDGDGGMGGALEYLVKLRGKSHMHCVWLSEQEVLAEPQGGARITRWQRARQAGTVGQVDVEPFPPEYTQVDKLVAERPSEAEGAAEGAVEFLVKWKLLTYADMTWEAEEDIEEEAAAAGGWIEKVRRFQRRPSDERYARARAKGRKELVAHVQREESPVYNGGHTLRPYQLEGLNWLSFCWCAAAQFRRAILLRNSSRNSAQFSDGPSITAPQAPQTECDPRRRDGARQDRAVGVVPPLPPFDAGAVGAIPRRRAAVDAVPLAARARRGPRDLTHGHVTHPSWYTQPRYRRGPTST